jgi:hypothetical protein
MPIARAADVACASVADLPRVPCAKESDILRRRVRQPAHPSVSAPGTSGADLLGSVDRRAPVSGARVEHEARPGNAIAATHKVARPRNRQDRTNRLRSSGEAEQFG